GSGTDPATRRAPDLALDVLRLAPALALRCRAPPPGLAPPPRAPLLLPRRRAALVAGPAGGAAPPPLGREGRVRVRRVRPREPARALARAPAESGLLVLQGRPGALGALAPRRPADRRRHDDRRAGRRLLRGLRHLSGSAPSRGGVGRGISYARPHLSPEQTPEPGRRRDVRERPALPAALPVAGDSSRSSRSSSRADPGRAFRRRPDGELQGAT